VAGYQPGSVTYPHELARSMVNPSILQYTVTAIKLVLTEKSTVGSINIGATKSIGTALFAAILGYLKETFSTFSLRMIYFRMLRIRIYIKNFENFFCP
jgi:hypothetical protein